MRLLKISFRLLVFAVCVGWLATSIDFSASLGQFSTFSLWASAAAAAVVIPALAGYAWRLRFLLGNTASIGDTGRATLIGIVFNNFLPVRGGEVIKAIYLSRVVPTRFVKTLAAVFWERFADLNAALLIVLLVSFALDLPGIVTTLTVGIIAIWLLMFAAKRYPAVFNRAISVLPSRKLRESLGDLMGRLTDEITVQRQVVINVQTILIWLFLMLQSIIVLRYAAHLPLSIVECIAVYSLATVFIMIPSAPANIGVMETGVVIGAGWFGIPYEQALAAAVLLHIVQLAPPSLIGLSWMLFHGDTTRLLLSEYHRWKQKRK